MKRWGLFLLRVTMGWLLVLWGIDKLQNVAHAQAVAETYYFGIGTQVMVQQIFGVLETLLGAMVILGRHRRRLYPVMLVVLLFTSIAGSSTARMCSSTRQRSSRRGRSCCGARSTRTTWRWTRS